jgi:hypothetical protein
MSAAAVPMPVRPGPPAKIPPAGQQEQRGIKIVPPTAPSVMPAPVAMTSMEAVEAHAKWPLLARIPMRMSAGIPLTGFKVRDLLALKPGQLITSNWESTADVPLHAGEVQVSWSEFEVVEQRMAVRVTRLA